MSIKFIFIVIVFCDVSVAASRNDKNLSSVIKHYSCRNRNIL